MIDDVKAAQGAANDMQGAGVKLWSLIMMYLCPHRQWKAGLGGQEAKWCLGAAAWLWNNPWDMDVVGNLYCRLHGTSAGELQGIRP